MSNTPETIRSAVEELARSNTGLSMGAWCRLSRVFLDAADEIEKLQKNLAEWDAWNERDIQRKSRALRGQS